MKSIALERENKMNNTNSNNNESANANHQVNVYLNDDEVFEKHANEDILEDEDEDEADDDEMEEDARRNLEDMCLSPPKPRMAIKRQRKARKRPTLTNSAANLDQMDSSLTDSLNQQQEKYEQELKQSASTHSILHLKKTQSIKSNLSSVTLTPSLLVTTPELSGSQTLDPFERNRMLEQITSHLKLALKTNQKRNHFDGQMAHKALVGEQQFASQSSIHQTPTHQSPMQQSPHVLNPMEKRSFSQLDRELKEKAEKIWKHIYDFFVHYQDRAESDEQIEQRLNEARSLISIIIDDIMNTNFDSITMAMDSLIKTNMDSLDKYSMLYENKHYIDQLCYVYWLVEEILNRIGYLESMYPSINQLNNNQPAYANSKFTSIYKTLLLWYKMITELTNISDIFGKYLGFAKRDENKKHWTWFHERFAFSKNEFEKIQNWLDQNYNTNNFCLSKYNRQVSFELRATKSCNLMYNRFEAQSIVSVNQQDENMSTMSSYRSSIDDLTANLLNDLSNNHLKPAKLHHLSSFLSRSSSCRSSDSPVLFVSPSSNTDSVPDFKPMMSEKDSNKADVEPIVEFHTEFVDSDESTEPHPQDPDTMPMSSEQTRAEMTNATHEQRQSIFTEFIQKRLRKQGLTNTCDEIRKIAMDTLLRTLQVLQINKCERNNFQNHFYYHLMPLHHKCYEYMSNFAVDAEKIEYGVNGEAFKKLNLPTPRPLYIHLSNVILDLMHICIKLQIKNKGFMKNNPQFKFTLMSIEVLTSECRECIEQAIIVRQLYYHMVFSVFERSEFDVQAMLENYLSNYDEDLRHMIEIYLELLNNWVHDLVAISNLHKALTVLKNEWKFSKNNLHFIISSEEIYAIGFCTMCNTLIDSLSNDINNKIHMQHKEQLMLQLVNDAIDDEDESNEVMTSLSTAPMDTAKFANSTENQMLDINLKFNEFKEEINLLRKNCLRTLRFCFNLTKDLELAAKYEVKSPIQDLLNDLKASNHVLVSFTNPQLKSSLTQMNNLLNSWPLRCFNPPSLTDESFLIFVPNELSKDKTQIIRLLFNTTDKDEYRKDVQHTNTNTETNQTNKNVFFENTTTTTTTSSFRRLSSSNSVLEMSNDKQRTFFLDKLSKIANINKSNSANASSSADTTPHTPFIITPDNRMDGYLLYLNLPKNQKKDWEWHGHRINLYASIPIRQSFYHHKNDCDTMLKLILVTSRKQILQDQRIELKTKLKGKVTLIKEKTSFHLNIEKVIDDLKDSMLKLRTDTFNCIKSIEKELTDSAHYDLNSLHTNVDQRYLSELWRVAYNLGIDLENECIKFMTQDRAHEFATGLANFCILWCEYIVSKTERGRGRTVHPYAANKGIQLLKQALDHSSHLSDQDFIRLHRAIESCISHVIGVRDPGLNKIRSVGIDILHVPGTADSNKQISKSTPDLSIDSKRQLNKTKSPSERFAEQCVLLDEHRESSALMRPYIGKILEKASQQQVITAINVNFRWLLGIFIGKGHYGEVYSCVNLENGEPMAVKKIPFKSNDATTIQSIVNEINNIQGLEHENLVKFYGVELHRSEILIFMEYCEQSTLDKISREASGLPERIVREFTKSLLKAVEFLHDKGIMHRDIKGANIFMKIIDWKYPDKATLKLGDFGCSIKFQDPIGPNKTKVTGLMGTFPYMAPEVMISSGEMDTYTFTADIWSVGCVVVEMFTGKRPWHPLTRENIMYKYIYAEKSKFKPPYPLTISQEAQMFLESCFEFDSNLRPCADKMLDHPFVKVESFEDKYHSI